MTYVTRFAPSPTGPLHLGHAYSALVGFERAKRHGGLFLLRIEDGDTSRCRPEWDALIFEDLDWLGLSWPDPVMRVSEREAAYRSALDHLANLGLTYPCSCTRRDITSALSAPQEGVRLGPDGIVYPGTCRTRSMGDHQGDQAIRLNMEKALAHLGGLAPLSFFENGPLHQGRHILDAAHLIENVGDVVLFRKDIGTAAYHLSVVVDDAEQGISEAVRGVDLFDATVIHRLLQALLGLPTPSYFHHDLIRDDAGKRLAKRDDAKAISKFRAEGHSPASIKSLIPKPS